MSERRSRFGDSVQLLRQAVENQLEDHPSPAKLAAYRRGDLPPEEADAIAEHLSWCRADAELVRDFDLLSQDPAEPPTKEDLDAAWRRFRGVEPEAQADEAPSPTPVVAFRPRPHQAFTAASALLAASLALALGLALYWSATQARRAEEALSPKPNAPRYGLFPPGSDRAGGELRAVVRFDPGSGAATVALNPADRFAPGRYRVRLLDARRRLRWESPPLEPTDAGDFSLDLRRGFVPPGLYELVLVRDGQESSPEARYPIEIAGDPP